MASIVGASFTGVIAMFLVAPLLSRSPSFALNSIVFGPSGLSPEWLKVIDRSAAW